MLLDAILKLHDQIRAMKLGANRVQEIEDNERARLAAPLPAAEPR